MIAYLYILGTLADWEIGYITAELSSGRFLDKTKPPIELVKIGNTAEPVKTMGGITLSPDECIDHVQFQEGDLLILPGADTWMEPENQKIIEFAADIVNKNVTVAAICGATMALAQHRLLDHRKHTSNDKDFLQMMCSDYSGQDNYIDNPAVTDNNLITASGLAPLEFSYEIFKKLGVMKSETLEAWYQLHKTQDKKYFYALMESMN